MVKTQLDGLVRLNQRFVVIFEIEVVQPDVVVCERIVFRVGRCKLKLVVGIVDVAFAVQKSGINHPHNGIIRAESDRTRKPARDRVSRPIWF